VVEFAAKAGIEMISNLNLQTTVESLRERARRLEDQAAELVSELDEVAVLLEWKLNHTISPRALQKIPVSDNERAQYRAMLTVDYADAVLHLIIQTQKIASQIKRSVPRAERREAIAALIVACHAAAQEQQMIIPHELEATIGD
jgi:hypothetical protein